MKTTEKKKMNEGENRKVVNRYHIKARHTKTDKHGQTNIKIESIRYC